MNKNESKYFNTASKMDDALVTLLLKKDFEYITIKDICELAKVNRSTFYLHYSNTCDLLEEVIERLTNSFKNHINIKETEYSIVRKKEINDLYLIKDEFLIPYLNFIKDNKHIYKAIKHNPNIFKVNKTYCNLFKYVFSPIMDRFGCDKLWQKYIMDFYMNGISSIILDWVNDDCLLDVKDIANIIKGLIVKYDKEND